MNKRIYRLLKDSKKSDWLERAKWREENKHLLKPRFLFAIWVLRFIRDEEINKSELSNHTNIDNITINKIVSGKVLDVHIKEYIKLRNFILNFRNNEKNNGNNINGST